MATSPFLPGQRPPSVLARLRAWATSYTRQGRYSPVGIVFHWVMAALILFQLGLGWYMGWLAAGGGKLQAFDLHASIGLVILVLALLRMVWRVMVPDPINDADIPGIQSRIAHVTHYIFYICFFGLALSGWAMWSALDSPALELGGVAPWPKMPFAELPVPLAWMIMDLAEDVHHLLVLTLAALVPLHAAAALKHHFWDRHDVLTGMLPEIPDEEKNGTPPRKKRRDPAPPPRSAGD